jgi:hypothetical protein
VFAGVAGGIPPEVLQYAAGYTQSGNNLGQRLIGLGMDAPEDKPHVQKGIDDAISYFYVPQTVLSVQTGNCG